jgi:hypothetical protein
MPRLTRTLLPASSCCHGAIQQGSLPSLSACQAAEISAVSACLPAFRCGGSDVGHEQPNGPTPQNITACPDPPGFDRTKFGLLPGQGRGAPEIDLIEVK